MEAHMWVMPSFRNFSRSLETKYGPRRSPGIISWQSLLISYLMLAKMMSKTRENTKPGLCHEPPFNITRALNDLLELLSCWDVCDRLGHLEFHRKKAPRLFRRTDDAR